MGSSDENSLRNLSYASFRLTGDELVVPEISALFAIPPDVALERGDFVRCGKRQRRQSTGVWALSSKDTVDSEDLERHLTWLLDIVEPAAQGLANLRVRRSLRTDFFCYWASANGHGGPTLSASTLTRIGAAGADLDLDLYAI